MLPEATVAVVDFSPHLHPPFTIEIADDRCDALPLAPDTARATVKQTARIDSPMPRLHRC